MREDLFTVVSELFITDTARYADIILPATMQARAVRPQVTWGHLYVMLNQPAIAAARRVRPERRACSAGSPRPWASTTTTGP